MIVRNHSSDPGIGKREDQPCHQKESFSQPYN
jgi:hypothetical protein